MSFTLISKKRTLLYTQTQTHITKSTFSHTAQENNTKHNHPKLTGHVESTKIPNTQFIKTRPAYYPQKNAKSQSPKLINNVCDVLQPKIK